MKKAYSENTSFTSKIVIIEIFVYNTYRHYLQTHNEEKHHAPNQRFNETFLQ